MKGAVFAIGMLWVALGAACYVTDYDYQNRTDHNKNCIFDCVLIGLGALATGISQELKPRGN